MDAKLSVVILAVVAGLFIQSTDGYKILGIFPTMAKSHYITGGALMKGLAEAGHEVTVISAFPQTKPLKNFRDIIADGIVESMKKKLPNILDLANKNPLEMTYEMFEMGILITNHTLQDERVKTFLNNPKEQFDLIILEIFLTESLLGIAHHFNAPVIGFSTFGASKWTNDLVGTPSPLSYVPHPFLSFSDKMSFVERLGSTVLTIYENTMFDYVYLPKQRELYNSVFTDENKPTLDTLRKDVSLVLLNNHFTMNFPRPYAINMIEVGGIHINRDGPKKLPEDMKDFIEGAKHGVIYFSMGSNIQSTQLPVEVRDGILKSFAKLKQRVLWKWEDTNLPGKSANVYINKWFPQDDILAHPNVKLFITHGGLLSTTEAAYHGVPIIGIPVFGDQYMNMARAANVGYALTIKYTDLNEATLTATLNEMLGNDKYTKQAKVISSRYRDQLVPPLQTAVYWVEYIAKHKGAPHLHSAGQDLGFITYHNLDVFAFLLVILYVLWHWMKKLFQTAFGKDRSRTAMLNQQRKQKNN